MYDLFCAEHGDAVFELVDLGMLSNINTRHMTFLLLPGYVL